MKCLSPAAYVQCMRTQSALIMTTSVKGVARPLIARYNQNTGLQLGGTFLDRRVEITTPGPTQSFGCMRYMSTDVPLAKWWKRLKI